MAIKKADITLMSAFFHLLGRVSIFKMVIKNEINCSQTRKIAELISDYKDSRTLASRCGWLMLNNGFG